MIVIYYDPIDNQIVGFYENCDSNVAVRLAAGQTRLEVPEAFDGQIRSLAVEARVVLDGDGQLVAVTSSPNPVTIARETQRAGDEAAREAFRDGARIKLGALGLTSEEVEVLIRG